MTIYFVQSGPSGPIKIGVSNNLDRRLSNLSIDNAEPIALLASCDGGMPLEQRLHRTLRGHCYRGEWFRPSSLVIDAIDAAKRGRLSEWVIDREAAQQARLNAESEKDTAVVGFVRKWISGLVEQSSLSGVAARAGLSPAKVRRFLNTGNGPITDFVAIARSAGDHDSDAITDILGKLGPQEMRA